ncbi:hypothetical protein NDI56_06760 [Haloarcula sp. S1CR25-12]|uniref:Cell surface protein n=1 Tax=Haloarcula saliterrae TaxID=2950534 RepID=A0ABU2FB67_9EURY|nr:hypothetical protein [Haloarcula sp. S1CR25-12]MDS0259090.1 hypothetical protein [Haloarcula sp. S1CR25-12]
MHRRRLLALVGSVAVGSGCTGTETDSPSGETVTPMPVPDPTDGPPDREGPDQPDQSVSITVRSAAVQPGVVTANTPDSISVVDDAGQYLVLSVAGDALDRSAVEFRFSGASYPPEVFGGRGLYRESGADDDDAGLLVFGLPETGDATDAELAWADGSWSPPERVVDRLGAPSPPMRVSFDGPETAGEDDPRLTVAVTNEGNAPGWFVLALNRQGPLSASAPVARIAGELTAGATTTRTLDAVPPEDGRATRYRLDGPGQENDLTHEIAPAESDEG